MAKKHRVKRQQLYQRTLKMDKDRRDHIEKQQEKGRLRNRGEASKRERPDNFRPEDDEENLGFIDDGAHVISQENNNENKDSTTTKQVGEKTQSKAAQEQQAAVAAASSKSIDARNKLKSKFGAVSSVDQVRSSAPSKLRRVEED